MYIVSYVCVHVLIRCIDVLHVITTIALTPTSHRIITIFVIMLRTFTDYSLSSFQLCNAVLLTVVFSFAEAFEFDVILLDDF